MSITSNKIASNGEEFTRSDYNGVSIIIRDKDGFINATKIANDNGKRDGLKKYFKSDKWNEICENFDPGPNFSGSKNRPFYTINSIGKCETYGTYVHPKLIHFVAEWCNISYAFKVARIMDNIDELKSLKNRTGNENLEIVIDNQKREIEFLKGSNREKDNKIDELNRKVDELLKENKKQTKKLNHLIDTNDDLKDKLIGNNGRLTGEEVRDSKVLMIYLTKDDDNEFYIKIIRSQPSSLRGLSKEIYNSKRYLFVSYLPEAINQNKSVLIKLFDKDEYHDYLETSDKGSIYKIHILKNEYMKYNYTERYKQFDDTKVTRIVSRFVKQFVIDYKRELSKQITNTIHKDESDE